jgi:hypothetical protein
MVTAAMRSDQERAKSLLAACVSSMKRAKAGRTTNAQRDAASGAAAVAATYRSLRGGRSKICL